MAWEKVQDDTPVSGLQVLRFGSSAFFIDPDSFGPLWLYFTTSAGNFSQRTMEEEQRDWPLEAIRQVRAELDRIETHLLKEVNYEASV